MNAQVNVNGWKKIGGDTTYALWVNEEIKLLRMRLNIPSRSFSQGHQTVLSNIIPVKYQNNTNVDLPWRQDSDLRISGANLNAYCVVALSNISIYQWHTWSYGTEY